MEVIIENVRGQRVNCFVHSSQYMQLLTLSWAKPIICCAKETCYTLQENVVSKQLTLYDQETTDQYVVDCKVLTV